MTVVYNRKSTIADTINSLHVQNYPNFEHIIQDGGSTDGTLDIVNTLKDARTNVISEPDDGIYDALNKGIARASGDVVGLMHSDDFFASKDVLEKISVAFADQLVDGVYGDLEYVSATEPDRIIRYWRAGPYVRKNLKRGWMPPHPTLYLRREVLEHWGNYDTNYQIAADYDAILRWLVRGRLRLTYIPEVLVRMRVGGESNRSFGRVLKKSREDYRAIRANGVGGVGTLFMKNTRKLGQFIQGGRKI